MITNFLRQARRDVVRFLRLAHYDVLAFLGVAAYGDVDRMFMDLNCTDANLEELADRVRDLENEDRVEDVENDVKELDKLVERINESVTDVERGQSDLRDQVDNLQNLVVILAGALNDARERLGVEPLVFQLDELVRR